MSPLWTNQDGNADDKPKYLNAADKAATVGVDISEIASGSADAEAVSHTGWNLKKTGTGSRAGRVSYECLVAGGIIAQDQDGNAFISSSSANSSSSS